jgi:hypothetical protein
VAAVGIATQFQDDGPAVIKQTTEATEAAKLQVFTSHNKHGAYPLAF